VTGRRDAESAELDAADVQTVPDLARVLRDLRRREARRSAGAQLTYRELAAKTGWSRGSLGEYFNGQILPPTDRFDVLIRLLGASAAEQGALATARDRVEERRRGTAPTAGELPVPRQLPSDVFGFTGRVAALGELDRALDHAERSPVVISVIAGSAGVGKTALAVHWAHRVRERFPDGQLYLDLQGFAAGPPVSPADALAGFLPALGVPAKRVPSGLPQAAALYRSMLADKRVLVVLDNAADPEQVRPLLPGGPGCVVVVTSRNRLGGLVARDGARRVALDVLTPDEAVALFARILGPDRVAAEPPAVRELARACALLPLALRIAAANLTAQPGRRIADFVAELTGGDRLAGLRVDSDDHDAVRAAFDQSYATLPAAEQRLFRLLGLVPGPDVTAPAAAALADTDPAWSARLLDRLAAAHLLTEHRPGRYSFHDQLRQYAEDRAGTDDPAAERTAATRRLYDWYLHTTDTAARVLYPEKLRLPLPAAGTRAGLSFDGQAPALAWLDGQRPNLVAAIRHAAEHGPHETAWLIADALRGYFNVGMHLVDWLAAARAGLAAAEAGGFLPGQATAQLSLADAHMLQSRHQEAIEHYERAVALARRAGWVDVQSAALGNLGGVYWQAGHLERAAEHLSRALTLDRRSGRLAGQSAKLGNLGSVYLAQGRLELAADHFTRSLALFRELGFRGGAAIDLTNLGEVYHALGRADLALDHLTEALTLFGEIGNRANGADALRCIADIHRDTGRYAQAREAAHTALEIARDTGNRRTEADVLNTVAAIHDRLDEHPRAVEQYQQALALASEVQARHPEVVALVGLAVAHRRAGRADLARAYAEPALDGARRTGYRVSEGQALTALAGILLDEGHPERAIEHAEQALAIQSDTGHQPGQAHALLILGHGYGRTAGRAAAVPHWKRAGALFTGIGAPEADAVRTLLSGG